MSAEGAPLRAIPDVVTYREMTEHVARQLEDFTRARSETILQMDKRLSGELGEIRAELGGVRLALEAHNRWHTDQLAGALARGPALRIALASALLTLIAVTVAVIALVVH